MTSWYLVLYGVLFLVVILLLPEGIIPTARKRWLQRTAQQAPVQPVSRTARQPTHRTCGGGQRRGRLADEPA